LNLVEQLLIADRIVTAFVNLVLVNELTEVQAVNYSVAYGCNGGHPSVYN